MGVSFFCGNAAYDLTTQRCTTAENNVLWGPQCAQCGEAAVKELSQSGVDMKRPSIVGKNYHTEAHVIG